MLRIKILRTIGHIIIRNGERAILQKQKTHIKIKNTYFDLSPSQSLDIIINKSSKCNFVQTS